MGVDGRSLPPRLTGNRFRPSVLRHGRQLCGDAGGVPPAVTPPFRASLTALTSGTYRSFGVSTQTLRTCLFLGSALLTGLVLPSVAAQPAPLDLTSPDHQLVVHFGVKAAANRQSGQLVYSATFHGKPIVDDSALGLELGDQAALGSDVSIADSKAGSGVDDYTLANQKVSKVHDAYNSLVIHSRGECRSASRHVD